MSVETAREPSKRWSTIAGTNPSCEDLREAAEEILRGNRACSELLARSTMQFVWRRQKRPHGPEWKLAEKRASQVLKHVREGGCYDGGH